jgi:hypothetical protein
VAAAAEGAMFVGKGGAAFDRVRRVM